MYGGYIQLAYVWLLGPLACPLGAMESQAHSDFKLHMARCLRCMPSDLYINSVVVVGGVHSPAPCPVAASWKARLTQMLPTLCRVQHGGHPGWEGWGDGGRGAPNGRQVLSACSGRPGGAGEEAYAGRFIHSTHLESCRD